MLIILFTALFGIEAAKFFTPSLAVFAAVSATYTNLAIGTALSRDNGILKRIRGTPIPPTAYLAGRVLSGIYLAFIAIVLMMGTGILFFDVDLVVRGLPAAFVTFLVGVGCFAALGMLVAAVSPSGDAAPAITNASLLPIAFISDVFIPLEDAPEWLVVIGNIFPLKPFAVAFRDSFDPSLSGAQFHWPELASMAVWGIVAAILAVRLFKWEPSSGSSGRRGRRRTAAAAD
jgi:ABC-2 type transport system permease protein